MALFAAVGQAQAIEGREAATQATHRALELLGRRQVNLGIVIASYEYSIQQVLSGVGALVGDAPLIGFSTSAELTSEGQNRRSVAVALLSSAEVQVRADWWSGFSEDSRTATQKMNQALQLNQASGTLLLITDGLNGDAKQLCAALPSGDYTLAGCLASGDLRRARTFQAGGRQSGSGGLAAAFLSGRIVTGVGLDHGWRAIGAYFRVTQARGVWVRTLDDQPPSETYARFFGYTPRDWGFPPLNELVRLYPLGVEQSDREELVVRSPLRVESDGSLRMNTTIPENTTAHLMVGSTEGRLAAARRATQTALHNLGTARPALAILWIDLAWQMQLESEPGAEIAAVRAVLGPDIPIIGGYTLGQVARTSSGKPELFNQHIEVVVFGEPAL